MAKSPALESERRLHGFSARACGLLGISRPKTSQSLGGFPLGLPIAGQGCASGYFACRRPIIIAGIAVLITALPLYSQDEVLRCRVIKVVDGDTIHVYADGKRLSIRFEGVDCPESGQIYGSEARDFVSKLLQDKIVTVRLRGANEGRIVARVIADGRDVSVELIRAGLAWHYKSLSKDKVLAEMESDARVRKAGLWSQPDPIPPWEYRRYEQKPAASAVGRPFLGNVQSLLFHRPGCVYYNCEKCQRYFATREEALKAEYKPCRICKP